MLFLFYVISVLWNMRQDWEKR